MKIKNFKLKIGLLVVFVIFVGLTNKAEAAGLSLGVAPPILQIDAVPPASIKTPITIQNFTDANVTFDIIFKPFTASKKENGQVEYLPKQDLPIFEKMQILDNEHSIKTLTLGPSQSKTLTLHIGIDKEQPPKDYYFSIVFVANPEERSPEAAVGPTTNLAKTAGGIATNVLLSIGPEGKAQGLIEEFSAPLFLEKGPVPFTVRVKNTSEHAIAPMGEILIVNMFGQIVGKVELAPVNILAGTIRAMPDLQDEEATPSAATDYRLLTTNPPKAFWPETFLLGPYSATLTLSLSEEGPKFSRTIRFFALPIQAFLGIILAILIVFFIRARLSHHLLLLLTFSLISLSLLFPKSAFASRLTGASDTISTSRPSTSTTLAKDQPAGALQVVIADNQSLFLAQDSALLGSETVTVASASASNTPEPNQRTIYLAMPLKTAHQKGDAVIVSIKALHTIKFTTANTIPQNGKIVITFQGEANNAATPSATTFAFNGLTPSQVEAKNASCSFTISAPSITCTLSSSVSSQTAITILIGSKSSPILINPTKTKTDQADIWSVKIKTQDEKGQDIDSASVKISTIEPIRVVAQVEPTLTFTIKGISNGTKIKDNNPNCTGNSDKTNSGIASEADFFDLGNLSSKKITVSASDLIVSTNLKNGYSITVTASGKLRNLITGYAIASSETPTSIRAGVEQFGIHPCGVDVNREDFGTGSLGGSAKLALPNSTKPLLLSFRASSADLVKTTIEYAASIKNATPVGVYKTVVSYLIMPMF